MLKLNTYVHLNHNLNVIEYKKNFYAGIAPDMAPYGFDFAKNNVNSLIFSSSHHESTLNKTFRKAITKILGFDLIHAFRNRKKFQECDIAWTMTENEFLGLLFLKTICSKKYNKKVICQTIWLANYYRPSLQNTFKKFLMKKADVILTHSKSCLPILEKISPNQTIKLMYFGISEKRFPITAPIPKIPGSEKIKIFSAGNDQTRDWDTILKAFGNDDRFEVIIICKWLNESISKQYKNIKLIRNPRIDDFKNYYINSHFVVISMYENIFSGITVALEAVASGACLVSSDTGGVSTYFDDSEVIFFPVGNSNSLKELCLNTTEDDRQKKIASAQKKFANNNYHNSGMINRYIELSNSLLRTES